MIVDTCDFDGDGAMHGCEFLACVHMYGKEEGCKAECDCKDNESDYCMGLNYCMDMMKDGEKEELV